MRVVVVGATGNVGFAVTRALSAEPSVESIVGVARRPPSRVQRESLAGRASWISADIADADLGFVDGADVVINLAWMIQPQRDERLMARTNIDGTRRLVDAVVRRGVPALVCASSVGTYAPAPKEPRRDESWPATGIRTSTYSRQKAVVESILDDAERSYPETRIVRMRTSLVFQRLAASEVHRLFLGRLLPWHLPRVLRFVPRTPGLEFQATHADDIADAYVRAAVRPVRGPFNIAAEPVLDPHLISEAVDGRPVPIPLALLRLATRASFALHVQPSEMGWIDMATQTPIMDTGRARRELAWSESRSSVEALVELLDGIGDGAGTDSGPLSARAVQR